MMQLASLLMLLPFGQAGAGGFFPGDGGRRFPLAAVMPQLKMPDLKMPTASRPNVDLSRVADAAENADEALDRAEAGFRRLTSIAQKLAPFRKGLEAATGLVLLR